MRTFSIYTLGCKVNQYESAQIRQFLEGLGLAAVKPAEKPDLFVINTCCVTATASAKSRQYIQRAKKLNKSAKKVIIGCLTALKTNELRIKENKSNCLVASREALASKLCQIIGGARSPVPERDASRQRDASRTGMAKPLRRGCSLTNSTNISDIAQHSSIKPDNNQKINIFTGLTSLPKLPLLTSFKEHTRAFLKVQDGCDGLCSYCIVPKIRPDVQNKPIEEAVSEAKALVSAGHKEIVVTGVNLGSYGRSTTRKNWVPDRKPEEATVEDRGAYGRETARKAQIDDCRLPIADLATENTEFLATENTEHTENRKNKSGIGDLLDELAKIEGLARIRVSSLEPGDISEGLLDVFCRHSNIMPHIHLSVQSGSDNILRRMCRQYSADELREKIALIKSRLDRPAITCDIIVGFPGETEEDFQETVELAKWAGFSKMHVFPFSARMGTAAMKMKDKVQPKVVKERAEILRNLGDCLGRKFREQFIGETCEVLIEDDEPMSGRCERYFIVKVKSKNQKVKSKNDIVKVKITAVSSEGATA